VSFGSKIKERQMRAYVLRASSEETILCENNLFGDIDVQVRFADGR